MLWTIFVIGHLVYDGRAGSRPAGRRTRCAGDPAAPGAQGRLASPGRVARRTS